jgi:tetratricopeptide (TPR) repeat protein
MTPERWQEARRLYHASVELDAAARASLLAAECGDDDELRGEVESLLAITDEGGSFMATPLLDGTLDEHAPEPESGSWVGRRLGAYEILAALGEGGMGKVFRAVRADGQYRQEVAIKVVRPGLEGEFTLAKFRAERQILATLEHPNIARLIDGGITDAGLPYFVMELVDAETIDRYCDRLQLPIARRLELFCAVCAAVQYAHQRLTVHRDLKPGNILVTAAGVPKLLDFGIAKVLGDGSAAAATVNDVRALTPEYASPEQIKGEPITTASDVYALGVVLYRLLTGQSPYRSAATEPFALAREVCDSEPRKPSAVVPAAARKPLQGDLDAIVLMALRKERERRYGSPAQLAEDLRAYLRQRPVAARPSTWRYRAGRFLARNKLAAAAAGLAVLALLGGLAATAWQYQRAVAERDRAERHFAEVRKLAKAMIFDLHDAIANLPGATNARKLVLDNALQYLDALAKEAEGDLDLKRELAGGYSRLGDIQGNPYGSNLGDSRAALTSYQKALAIREAVAAARPDNQDDQLALAKAEQYFILNDNKGNDVRQRLAHAQRARAIVEPLLASHPEDLSLLEEMARVYEELAIVQGGSGAHANLGDNPAALDCYRKALAIEERILKAKPADIATKIVIATMQLNVGLKLVETGDRAGALAVYRTALNRLEALPTASTDFRIGQRILLAHERIADIQITNGDSAGAVGNYRKSMAIAETMVAADPQNIYARGLLVTELAVLGNALATAGRRDEARALLRQAIERAEAEVARDPRRSFVQQILGLAYVLRAHLQRDLADPNAAEADYRKAESVFAGILGLDGQDMATQLRLTATRGKLAELLAEQRHWQAAADLYGQVLASARPLAEAEPPNLQAQYTLADALAGQAAALQAQAADRRLPAAQRSELHAQACAGYAQSQAVWQVIPNPGFLSPLGFDSAGPAPVARQLAQCTAARAMPIADAAPAPH